MGADFITEWNIFDSIIYRAENIASKIVSGIKKGNFVKNRDFTMKFEWFERKQRAAPIPYEIGVTT